MHSAPATKRPLKKTNNAPKSKQPPLKKTKKGEQSSVLNFNLDNDVLLEAFHFLDQPQLMLFRQVCSKWNQIISNSRSSFPSFVVSDACMRPTPCTHHSHPGYSEADYCKVSKEPKCLAECSKLWKKTPETQVLLSKIGNSIALNNNECNNMRLTMRLFGKGTSTKERNVFSIHIGYDHSHTHKWLDHALHWFHHLRAPFTFFDTIALTTFDMHLWEATTHRRSSKTIQCNKLTMYARYSEFNSREFNVPNFCRNNICAKTLVWDFPPNELVRIPQADEAAMNLLLDFVLNAGESVKDKLVIENMCEVKQQFVARLVEKFQAQEDISRMIPKLSLVFRYQRAIDRQPFAASYVRTDKEGPTKRMPSRHVFIYEFPNANSKARLQVCFYSQHLTNTNKKETFEISTNVT